MKNANRILVLAVLVFLVNLSLNWIVGSEFGLTSLGKSTANQLMVAARSIVILLCLLSLYMLRSSLKDDGLKLYTLLKTHISRHGQSSGTWLRRPKHLPPLPRQDILPMEMTGLQILLWVIWMLFSAGLITLISFHFWMKWFLPSLWLALLWIPFVYSAVVGVFSLPILVRRCFYVVAENRGNVWRIDDTGSPTLAPDGWYGPWKLSRLVYIEAVMTHDKVARLCQGCLAEKKRNVRLSISSWPPLPETVQAYLERYREILVASSYYCLKGDPRTSWLQPVRIPLGEPNIPYREAASHQTLTVEIIDEPKHV